MEEQKLDLENGKDDSPGVINPEKSFKIAKIPIAFIFVFYLTIALGAVLIDHPHQYRQYIRPYVLSYNAILLISLFWSIVESVKPLPLVIATAINAFLGVCDLYVIFNFIDYTYVYPSLCLVIFSLLTRPVVCFILKSKSTERCQAICQESETENIGKGDDLKDYKCDWQNWIFNQFRIEALVGWNLTILLLIIFSQVPYDRMDIKILSIICNALLLFCLVWSTMVKVKSQCPLVLATVLNLVALWIEVCFISFASTSYYYRQVHLITAICFILLNTFIRVMATIVIHRYTIAYGKNCTTKPFSRFKCSYQLKLNLGNDKKEEDSQESPTCKFAFSIEF